MRPAGVVLAAGRGSRLRPLTDRVPKPLVEVAGRTLLDHALKRLAPLVDGIAVNAHWLAEQVVAAVGQRAHVSVEQPEALGTAGAIGLLRPWIDGRDVLITNSDAWYGEGLDLEAFVGDWDGSRPRLLVVEDLARPDFEARWRFAGTSLLPRSLAAELEPVPSGLYEVVWSRVELDLVPTDVPFVDCGTAEHLALAARRAATDRHDLG